MTITLITIFTIAIAVAIAMLIHVIRSLIRGEKEKHE